MNDECQPSEECCPPGPPLEVPSLDSVAGEVGLAALAKALAHPMRVRILRILLRREACVCAEIVVELPIAQATVSQHLKVLREAGLIQGEIDGPRVCYCVNREGLAALAALTGDLAAQTPAAEDSQLLEVGL